MKQETPRVITILLALIALASMVSCIDWKRAEAQFCGDGSRCATTWDSMVWDQSYWQ